MRWSGQELGAERDDALPGLARLNNLVRSVQTPEFAGITFHEILAKSALNHVPGAAKALPFGWTINPYRGCGHQCVFCLAPDTLILMADGSEKPLREVEVGDQIYGTEAQGKHRRYVRTTVEAKWPTRKRAYRVTLADGTVLTASGDHRFLTDRGWKYVQRAEGSDQRPYLTTDNRMMGFGAAQPPLSRDGVSVTTSSDLRVVSIDELEQEMDLIDISTGTGDFIANGVISHNCFARNTHTYLDFDAGRDFDTQIVVKVNVAEVLERELARPSWERPHVALGTNTDPYQRAEGRYRLMPGIIAALAASDTPFSILTKGTLLRRDLPLLQAAAERVPVETAISITVFDDEQLQRSLEPGAPSTAARLATVKAVRDAGLPCAVFLMPVLPYLTDSREQLDTALARIAEARASSVAYSALHLRPGAQEWFAAWLLREHPELAPRYRELYGNGAYAPKEYRARLAARIRPLLRRHGLDRPRIDPATGTPGTRPRRGATALAAELSPAAAAALQPTLF